MPFANLRMALQVAKLIKRYFPVILILAFFMCIFPVLIITTLFSFVGWFDRSGDDLDPDILAKAELYEDLAASEGIAWQQLLAVDLALHEMDQDKLTPEVVLKKFIYTETVKVPHYIEVKREICLKKDSNGKCVDKQTFTEKEIDRYDEVEVKRKRTYTEVMALLNFTDEQREAVAAILDVLSETGYGSGASLNLSLSVLAYEPIVRRYAIEYNIPDLVNIILAMIQQETGGRLPDVMQSSESAGFPPNYFTNPEDSIRQGVWYFAQQYAAAQNDVKLALQAYNFGGGFISYALERGGYSKETAIAFSEMMAEKMGWSRYGDVDYVDHVLRYANGFASDGGQIFDFDAVYAKMSSYLGVPYMLGGRNPDKGPVDCSGLIEYVFAQFGINISGTAQSQYNKTKPVPADKAIPGDLVFFYTGGDREITHVGMYIGNDQFINANSKGVSISSVSAWSNYYDNKNNVQYVFKGFRRIQAAG